MISKDEENGGPAFGHGNPTVGGHPGMTLRDWFAGQALTGMTSITVDVRECKDDTAFMELMQSIQKIRSRLAYDYADAMLKAREDG